MNSNLKKAFVKVSLCPQNHPCPAVPICPVQALTQFNFNAPVVDLNKCIGCGKCAIFCPKNALCLDES